MTAWDDYPASYRAAEVTAILNTVQAGECVCLAGLSGAGKSNLLGFLAHRASPPLPGFVLIPIDCNRLRLPTPDSLMALARRQILELANPSGRSGSSVVQEPFEALSICLADVFSDPDRRVCVVLDRFDLFYQPENAAFFSNLRALRDDYKYRLTYLAAGRLPLPPNFELSELFYAHTLWLGPLSEADARWSIQAYARRQGLAWDEPAVQSILNASGGYPSLLRAVCAAEASQPGAHAYAAHPAVAACLDEFWSSGPDIEALRQSRLTDIPLLMSRQSVEGSLPGLTAKETAIREAFETWWAAHSAGIVSLAKAESLVCRAALMFPVFAARFLERPNRFGSCS